MAKKRAFAFRNFESKKILQRKFFRDIEVDDKYVNWSNDDDVIANSLGLGKLSLQELEFDVKSLNNTLTRVEKYENLIKRHLTRLNALLEFNFLYDWGDRLTTFIRNYSLYLADVSVLEMQIKSVVKRKALEIQKRCLQSLPGRLKTARVDAGLTQQQIADFIDVKKAVVSHYEKGIIEPPLNRLILLSKRLDISINWLIGLEK